VVTDEPTTYDLFRSATRSACHLETRDSYTPDDPDWRDWREGRRFHPAERWKDWSDLIRETASRGVAVRRLRIISEPITDYIRYEYDVTTDHNVAAGETVRWLPRRNAIGILVPPVDFWVFDESVVVFNHFDGPGDWVTEERRDDKALAVQCAAAFDAAWEIAIPHEQYTPR
jgi:hypothetical protein